MNVPAIALCVAVAVLVTVAGLRVVTRRAWPRLTRINHRGVPVPAVLGVPLVSASTLAAVTAGVLDAGERVVPVALICVLVLLGAAGLADDLRGDETERGYRGHLRALAAGRLTGGGVKIVAGAVAGAGSAALLTAAGVGAGWLALALVPLAANAVNLFDRAPGRAGKVVLPVLAILFVFGPGAWVTAGAGLSVSLLVVLGADLRERGMLGDAGSNALGGAAGLGLAVASPLPLAAALTLGLLFLNLASERVSFSEVIARNGILRRLDRAGRIDG